MIDEIEIRQKADDDGVTHFATGVAVLSDDKLLVVRRVTDDEYLPGEWEIPGGGVDEGETIEEGAIRELREETNLEVNEIMNTFEGFDYTTPSKPKVRQVNFRVSVKTEAIKLTEHDKFLWITPNDIPGLKTNPVMERCLRNAFN